MKVWIYRLMVSVVALALTGASPANAQDDVASTLESIERSLWDAWKAGDYDVFRAHLADGAVHTGAMGVMVGREPLLEMMRQTPCDVRTYSFSDLQVHQVTEHTAVVTYRAEQDATCGDEVVPSAVWVSSVYVDEGGEWKNVLYQETPAS